jgi:beta-glucosidase-like glycosyl hydrolase/CubicO group peptidase (beta-lactamase class C family)
MTKSILLLILLVVQFIKAGNSNSTLPIITTPEAENHWVDSLFNTLSPDEKIGQLFMIRAHSDKGPEHILEVERQIKQFHVGGLCFFQGTPLRQAELTNNYQSLSRVPLMVAIDAEWGLGMRHKDAAISFPHQLTLGAIQDNKIIYEMGAEIAKELKRVGTHINFAPVVDININAANPVINDRSFGENRLHVTGKSYQYMMGLQDNGIVACAKHFPGHGDTDVDSHLDLPLINHKRYRLDSIELFPFKLLVEQGLQSIMIAHLQVPALESDPLIPASLSTSTMTGLLKNEWNYNGLIFSDALEMKGVTKNFKTGDVEVTAFKAGCDILCLPNSIDTSFIQLKAALDKDPALQEKLNIAVKKILHAKYRMGLNQYEAVNLTNLIPEVNNSKAASLKTKLFEQALTTIKNKNNLLPITELDQHKIASISIGSLTKTPFQWRLESYAKVTHFQVDTDITDIESKNLLTSVKGKDIVIVGLYGLNKYIKQNFGLTQSAVQFIKELSQTTRVVLVPFGNPYILRNFEQNDWILEAYEPDPIMQDLAAQAIFGAISTSGKLPVTACPSLPAGTGINTLSLMRFGYSIPERVNVNSAKLKVLDQITEEIVDTRSAPGGQLLVARSGKIIYHKSFGYLDYDKKTHVADTEMYDLASITKLAASTLAVMRLYDEGKINLDQPMSEFLPDLKGTNKESMTLPEIMSHQAGLIGGIPFYKETLLKVRKHVYRLDPLLYSNASSSKYSLPITKNMYLKTSYDQMIWKEIMDSQLRTSKSYRYSDLGFYLISNMVRFQSGMRLDQFMNKYFYQPLMLGHTLYNPYQKFPVSATAPTEKDDYWRKQTVQGYVHDMGAAMLDGVSGHAGLFSNSLELATLMQLLLNGW